MQSFISLIKCCQSSSYDSDLNVDKLISSDSSDKNLFKVESVYNSIRNQEDPNKSPYVANTNGHMNFCSKRKDSGKFKKNCGDSSAKNEEEKEVFLGEEEGGCEGGEVCLSGELFGDEKVVVGSTGLKNGLRKTKDGHNYFGVEKAINNDTNNKSYEILNDFLLKVPHNKINFNLFENSKGKKCRIFDVFYEESEEKFYIKMIHDKMLMYLKVNTRIYFEQNKDFYLIIGTIFMTINVRSNIQNDQKICVYVEIENEKSRKYVFSKGKCPIKIGRNHSDINISQTCISKKHGKIDWDGEKEKFYYEDLGSTNGTTFLLRKDDAIQLQGEMNFKLEEISFTAIELNNKIK